MIIQKKVIFYVLFLLLSQSFFQLILSSPSSECNEHGELNNDTCSCYKSYFGVFCSLYNCSGILFNSPKVCKSIGECVSPDHCIYNIDFDASVIIICIIFIFFTLLLYLSIALFLYIRVQRKNYALDTIKYIEKKQLSVEKVTPSTRSFDLLIANSRKRHNCIEHIPLVDNDILSPSHSTNTMDDFVELNGNLSNFDEEFYDDTIPQAYLCPISLLIMKNPCRVVESNQVYEKDNIIMWFKKHNSDPCTNKQVISKEIIEVNDLQKEIDVWREKHLMLKNLDNEQFDQISF